MKITTLFSLLCLMLIGCNKVKNDVLSDASVDDSQHSTVTKVSILGEWQSGQQKSEWGIMTSTLKFNSDGSCLLLIFSTEIPDKPIGSIDGSWKFDPPSGTINWKESKYLSDEVTLTKNIETDTPESFRISDDSILQLTSKSGAVDFKKSSENK